MPIRALDAASYLTTISGNSISNLQLQKLLYVTDLNFVGKYSERLIIEDFQAWDYGPVIESLYHRCKAFGSKPLPNVFWGAEDISGSKEAQMLDTTWSFLGSASPAQLVETTHSKFGAWVRRYVPGAKQIKITTQDMTEEYGRRKGSSASV